MPLLYIPQIATARGKYAAAPNKAASLDNLFLIMYLSPVTYVNFYRSPLGTMLMTSSGVSLTGLYFTGQKYYPAEFTAAADASRDGVCAPQHLPLFDDVRRYLDVYFSGSKPHITFPFLMTGATAFRRTVWQILLTIPYGTVMTYKQVADEAGKLLHHHVPARAAGQAVGHNPLSIIVPCHRVVGANGELTGYAGGLERKAALLQLERLGCPPALGWGSRT